MTASRRTGFTLVELLIVIVVIAILAAITIVAYNGIQQKARASSLWSDLKLVDKGFNLYLTELGVSTWPLDTDIDPTNTLGNATLSSIITNTGIKNYIQSVPDIGENWSYDNDGDSFTANPGYESSGVDIFIDDIDKSLATTLDESNDDGVFWSGKIRYRASTSRLYYGLSNEQSF